MGKGGGGGDGVGGNRRRRYDAGMGGNAVGAVEKWLVGGGKKHTQRRPRRRFVWC